MTTSNDRRTDTAKLLANDYLLDLNRSLMVPQDMELPPPWNLPSRLFRFPIWVSGAAASGERRLGLMHPLLVDHPFVRRVEADLGIVLDTGDFGDERGFPTPRQVRWWHAVDLVGTGHWRELLKTRQFTSVDDIAGAVSYGLDHSPYEGSRQCGHISTGEARTIMDAIGSTQPLALRSVASQLAAPASCHPEKGAERWPVNSSPASTAEGRAWSRILGIEAGWLKHDASGFLQWTSYGRDAFVAGDAVAFTEEKTGQGAFAF